MLFQLTLPKEAEKALAEASRVQMLLFEWAVQVQGDQATIKNCRKWLIKDCKFRKNRAYQIFSWIENDKYRKSAFYSLLKYAKDVPIKTKEALHCRMKDEQQRLLDGKGGPLISLPKKISGELIEISTYLIMFYNEFRSNSGLHTSVTDTSEKYTSQKFLNQLHYANINLNLCSFCQQNAYMNLGGEEGDLYIYTDIDHFFPKSYYPHLAIHPYNLIPLCHACNSWRKVNRDPLDRMNGGRWNTEDIWTPYRHKGLFNKIVLQFEYSIKNREIPYLKVQGFHLCNHNTFDEASIEVWDRIYKPRESWQKSNNIIGEKLFRRVGQYIRMFHLNNDEELYDQLQPYLDELVATFESEELGREPYSFPMLWLLVHILNDEDPASGQTNTPFLNTINAYFEKTLADANERRQRGSALRAQAAALPRTPPRPSTPTTPSRPRRPRARRAP